MYNSLTSDVRTTGSCTQRCRHPINRSKLHGECTPHRCNVFERYFTWNAYAQLALWPPSLALGSTAAMSDAAGQRHILHTGAPLLLASCSTTSTLPRAPSSCRRLPVRRCRLCWRTSWILERHNPAETHL